MPPKPLTRMEGLIATLHPAAAAQIERTWREAGYFPALAAGDAVPPESAPAVVIAEWLAANDAFYPERARLLESGPGRQMIERIAEAAGGLTTGYEADAADDLSAALILSAFLLTVSGSRPFPATADWAKLALALVVAYRSEQHGTVTLPPAAITVPLDTIAEQIAQAVSDLQDSGLHLTALDRAPNPSGRTTEAAWDHHQRALARLYALLAALGHPDPLASPHPDVSEVL